MGRTRPLALGLRGNLLPFAALSFIVFLVGALLGVERVTVPLIGRQVYHVTQSWALSFIVSFGVTKALVNLGAGRWSDRIGRRRLLIAGWLAAVPMVAVVLLVHRWWAVVLGNIFLGANQGLAWTMTVTAQLDLVAPRERGLAMGINEGMGYLGVAAATVVAARLADGDLVVRPFVLAAGILVVGFLLTLGAVPETNPQGAQAPVSTASPVKARPPLKEIWMETSWRHPALSAITVGGLVNKLADTVAWGLLPLFLAQRDLPVSQIAWVSGVYGATWGAGQFFTGPLSDAVGRRLPIAVGFWLLGAGLWALTQVNGYGWWLVVAGVAGLGMALLYPNLNAAVADYAEPASRGAVLGVYRLWRDGGYAIGGICLGVLAAGRGTEVPILSVAALAGLTGCLLARRLDAGASAEVKRGRVIEDGTL
jgi:MFS family permease